MNNESIKSTTISASLSTTSSTNSITTKVSSPPSTSISSFLSAPSTSLSASYTSSTHFDATVNAITAAVNASSHLPATPPNAAVVVAVAVSSLAAAIIPDTPIVSIAGSTLSEITTTTTSTKTTPTPVPTSKETTTNKNIKNSNSHKDILKIQSDSSPSSNASVKGLNQMSVANSSLQGVISNATGPAANAAAAVNDNSSQIHTTTLKSSSASETLPKQDSAALSAPTEDSSPSQSVVNATAVSKTDENNISNENKSKDFLSESWEESRLKDWDDSKLKELLDEAYSYKNPRDKENKSKTFLQLLEKAENEDQSYPFRAITSRGSRNLSSSITSNSYHHYQNSHYHSHSHNHNRSHHHHKQGGSLQDLFEIGLHETQLDCDQTFGGGIGGNQRTRRQNHNSRQKKYSSSVSSRQREGGSLPSNVNVTHQLTGSGGVGNDLGFMQLEGTSSTSSTGKSSKKEQKRNAAKVGATGSSPESKESGTTNTTGGDSPSSSVPGENTSTANTAPFAASVGDFIIDMGEPMMDIQQQQKILQSKGQDSTKQGGQSFYERLASIDKRIPRVNLMGSTKGSYFAPTSSHCYVDETVRFNTLERNGSANNSPNTSTMDAKFLPLDENYKSCKSVLGGDGGEKPPEILGKPKTNSIYTKISSPASGSSVLGGTTNNIATLTQRQLDENGNALSELYPNSSTVGGSAGATMQINCVSPTAASPGILLTSCGNNVSTSATVTIPPHPTSTTVSTSATITTYASGPSQAKAKAKKKSQQERNTKTVDVESVAGYRGKDPVEELVRYIESSGEGGGATKTGDKKKERKKDKDKHQKLKKSNSLEELRSGAKMEVHELKRTAATTESNAVLLRQKSGTAGGGKQNKNNSSSTADINRNLEGKTTNTNNRKTDRRSWGNEDLKYLDDQQNANANDNIIENDEKVVVTNPTSSANPAKERKNNKGSSLATREERDKDKTAERNERNLTNNATNHSMVQQNENKMEKLEKIEKVERRKRYDTPPNAVTIIDIVPMESACPETAEFHVVTKKKKPKKPKVISNSEETSVTFNRAHNFTIQKSSTLNQQHQSIPRYKYYQHDGNNSSGNQQHQQQYNNNTVGVVANSNSAQQQYQQSTETYNNTDKSRRKSTSSVPPSEKSDSSDLDSVHSLPIESTKANAAKENSQQKMKGAKISSVPLASNKNTITQAPISYADIARTNKEIADAAAAAVNNVTNNVVVEISSTESKNAAEIVNNVGSECMMMMEDKPNVISTTTIKPQKAKKSQIKQDFPELGPTISYSQSVSASNTSANTTTQSQVAGFSGELSPASQADVTIKSSPTEQFHPPQNPQILQKSKSVENDTMTSITNTSSSYMAPLNNNNLDQQYPALEKTVKRHSSANVSTNYSTANQTSSFNFAAAAKQQIAANSIEPNVNCNKNLALTTSTNANTQTATQAGNSATTTSITNTNTTIITTTTNNYRKSKERSPPITTQNTIDTTNSKKSKKERQQQQQQQIVDGSSSQIKLSTIATSKKLTRSQLKSSNSLPLTATTQTNSRPAVIILNDDRNSSGCAADNQFTFGDFNEDELKLFEDDVGSSSNNTTDTDNALDNQDLSEAHEQHDPSDGTLKSPVAAYFNDSGASCENDIVNNSTPDMLLNSSIDASSPNTSFVNSNHANNGGVSGHMTNAGNNQSSDSGIYTDKAKTSSSSSGSQNTTSRQNKQMSHTKEVDNKLNTFLSNTKCPSVHTSMDNLDPPPPQQLETCNDIETAIIAAAREAAKQQQKTQHQSQQFKNSNTSSNSSSFSSSSSAPFNSNNRNYSQHGIGGSNDYQHQQAEYDDADDDDSFVNTPRSRSPSRPRRISIQFIPPTMATAFSTQQHNDIIIDFIGSAWEEIANSKVTKVYDGQ